MWQVIKRFIFLLLSIILLVFALDILFLHAQYVWYRQAEYGWYEAVMMELGIAGLPIAGSIIIVLIVLGLFVWIQWSEEKRHKEEQKHTEQINQAIMRLLSAIAKKLGVDDDKPK